MKIFLSIFLLCILALSLSFSVDASAMELQDEALSRAMAAFGLAKGLNAVISLLQGTEFSFTPIGMGLNFSIGEVLDPFNDIVERFSWVMLFASISLGIQKFLLLLSAKLFLQVAFGVSIFLVLGVLWIKKLSHFNLFIYSFKLFSLLLFLRFSALLFVYSSELLYTSTLQIQYSDASTIVEKTKTELEDLESKNRTAVIAEKSSGFFDGVGAKYNSLKESFNLSKQLQSLQNSIEEASNNIVTLMTIFIIQSMLMPLLYLWFAIISIKFIFKIDIKEDKLKLLYNH